jgi:hypothetical protein
MFPRIGACGGQHGDSLGHIDRAAAAISEYGVATSLGQQFHRSADPLD